MEFFFGAFPKTKKYITYMFKKGFENMYLDCRVGEKINDKKDNIGISDNLWG